VGGRTEREPLLELLAVRKGDEGRRMRPELLLEIPRPGELLLSVGVRSGSKTDERTGERGGNDSSSGFRGVRTLLGEPEGLSERRRSWGERSM
jgi:hypothetical protein